ncbi:MAG: glycogen synthase [Sphaerochaetaceae bacterium]|nr:glycogen synthase [Sphaerochaetaceae bacterium]MDX9938530.1 glycogen synthase [Sphaerochaetaceae bacterium]
MRILMVSSEAVPFSKSGGLADVATSLSMALAGLGNDVRLILPCYGSTDDSAFTEMPVRLELPISSRSETVGYLQKQHSGITVYLVTHPSFTTRKGIYGDTSFAPYADNLLRYTLLSKAALALCKEIGWIPDILHGHDWTAGFLPALAKDDPQKTFAHTKTVFTIHNLAYQGEFSRCDLLLADIPVSAKMLAGSGLHKKANMMKAALESADIITTVSPTYAKEIQGEEQGCGLDALLRSRSAVLTGILNGIDTDEWSPEKDALLDVHYSSADLSGKAVLKNRLQKRFSLPIDDSVPVIGMISRIAEQKGFVELCQGSPCTLEQIVTDLPVQLVIIGTGDKAIEEKLTTLAELHPNLSVNLIFSNEAAHLVEAGSDFFLMPSRYEPCGLNQMYSLRYGTIPIARRTGGLADSIVDIGSPEGTGILFDSMTGVAIHDAVRQAVDLYYGDTQLVSAIRKRGMAVDFTWMNSAEAYMHVYSKIHKG